MLIPSWGDGALNGVCGVRLIAVDGNDGKGVRETEYLTLDEGIGGENWE